MEALGQFEQRFYLAPEVKQDYNRPRITLDIRSQTELTGEALTKLAAILDDLKVLADYIAPDYRQPKTVINIPTSTESLP